MFQCEGGGVGQKLGGKFIERGWKFPLRLAPPHYNKFHLGKNMNQEGGGYEFEI